MVNILVLRIAVVCGHCMCNLACFTARLLVLGSPNYFQPLLYKFRKTAAHHTVSPNTGRTLGFQMKTLANR